MDDIEIFKDDTKILIDYTEIFTDRTQIFKDDTEIYTDGTEFLRDDILAMSWPFFLYWTKSQAPEADKKKYFSQVKVQI